MPLSLLPPCLTRLCSGSPAGILMQRKIINVKLRNCTVVVVSADGWYMYVYDCPLPCGHTLSLQSRYQAQVLTAFSSCSAN